jgi:hypothetical protein
VSGVSALNGNSSAGEPGATHERATPESSSAGPVVGLVPARRPAIAGSVAELRARRRELAEQVAALTWDLGGLAYEMAVRDHYRLDVIARRAADLQAADAELGEVTRLLGSTEEGIGGQCRACGAVHSRGAGFCWHCGTSLIDEARPAMLDRIDPA